MIPRRASQASCLLLRCRKLQGHLSSARAARAFSATTTTSSSSSSTPPFINHAPTAVDFETDVLVIGAGVVGLSVARAAARRGAQVVLLERNAAFGTETSSRSSEVIHAGLYYPPGSLKATLCARGRDMLYDYCAEKGVAHKQIGKLVVATGGGGGGDPGGGGDADEKRLEALAANAEAACARAGALPLGLELLSGSRARELEPALSPGVTRALLSPRTGIVDSHGLMAALLADAESGGATTLALRSAAVPMPPGKERSDAGGLLSVAVQDVGGGEAAVFGARVVVNCAGLGAEACARGALAHLGRRVAATAPRVRYAKGNYFELGAAAAAGDSSGARRPPPPSSSSPRTFFFSRLIYPLPEDGGLGIHLTLDLSGRPRFGPDVEWLPPPEDGGDSPPAFDYRVQPERAEEAGWRDAIRSYWPHLPDHPDALVPAYSGVRPKLCAGPGAPAEDFGVQAAKGATWRGGQGHGVKGLVCLFGVESPGLTSALALAEHVVEEAGLR